MILGDVRVFGQDDPVDLRISGDRLVAVGGGARVELGGAFAFPGLINSHDHLEFGGYPLLSHGPYPDWVAWADDIQTADRATIDALQRVPTPVRVACGLARNLLGGVTTVVQHGARPSIAIGPTVETPGICVHSVRERGWRRRLVTAGAGPAVVHVGEGTLPRARAEVDRLLRWNLGRRPLVAVHGVAMTARQASRFAGLVWCPVSNLALLGATAEISAFKRHTPIVFGTDSPLSAPGTMFDHLRFARAIGGLSDRELVAAVTTGPAALWKWPDRGRLDVGAAADVIVVRATSTDPYEAFFGVRPEDLLLVICAGRVLLVDGEIPVDAPGLHPWRIGGRDKRLAVNVGALPAAMRERLTSPGGGVTPG